MCHDDGHISKVTYDDNEPPKNHIWGKSDGTYWQYINGKWMMLNIFIDPETSCCFPAGFNTNYVSRCELNNRLRVFKNDLYSELVRYFDETGQSADTESIREYFETFIIPRIEELENNPSTYDDTEVINSINTITNNVSDLNTRLTTLEQTGLDIDTSMFITAEDVS